MNRLIRTVQSCLAGMLIWAGGCHRQPPEQASPVPNNATPSQPNAAPPASVIPPPTRSTRDRLQQFAGLSELSEPAQSTKDAPADPTLNQAEATDASSGKPLETAHPQQPAPAQPKAPSDRSKKQQADAVFDHPTLLRVQIEIPPSGLNALRTTRWEGGGKRAVVQATVREGEVVYTNVAVHLKGSAGSFRDIDHKPAFTLKFDKFVPGQSFHGLHKISLNNSVQDSSYLCEKIARELFIAGGVPAPRAGHATVELNGRPLGFYVVLEGANKQFLKRFFDGPKGNLYDGGFCRDIGSRLVGDCGEDPNNHSGLKALRAAVRDARYARLESALDMDRFLSMVALEIMLGHWDGYSLNKNNWRIYHDLSSNRMVFIPHGLDQLFGAGRQFNPDDPILPHNVQGEVTRAVLATREGQRRYRERFGQLFTNVFNADKIVARVDEIVAGVAPALAQTDAQAARNFQRRASALKQRIVRRSEGLRQQLGAPPIQSLEFGSHGILSLTGWKQSVATSGDPVLSETQDTAGKPVLVINAGASPSSGSWRTRLNLGPGKYLFQGRVRVIEVKAGEGGEREGAGLRISKGTMPPKLTGTSDWKTFKYPFEIAEKAANVELVCELKADAGEAWFDASSLKLIRLQ